MINFSDEYKTGIEILDHEHQALFSILNRVSCFLIDNSGATKMEPLIMVFSRMAKTHFRNEEEILETTDHPDKETHKTEHQSLEKRIDELLLNVDHEEIVDIIDRLKSWLAPHILEWDTKIKIADKVYFTHAQL